MTDWTDSIGAQPGGDGTFFRVWAPSHQRVDVIIFPVDREDLTTAYELVRDQEGYFSGVVQGVLPGTRYKYRLDTGDSFPDPASRFQPDGVHGPSQVVDLIQFPWTDQHWTGVALADLVVYELHVGTATDTGTFDALIERLDSLKTLGVTAIEIMPVADFPGQSNWGYDGVALFAPSRAYGGPGGLMRLVDAAHACGLGVILDVVYNHLGPEGNYLPTFSNTYFTTRHMTSWGPGLNFDGQDSGPVRNFFLANACSWARDYHLDGLRLDATHAILDDSPIHIIAEIAARVRELATERHFLVIAENEHRDPCLLRPLAAGCWGLDGVWADDFHHQVRVALAGDRDGYYQYFTGSTADLAATLHHGWFAISPPAAALDDPLDTPIDDIPLTRFVYCIQNHDQIGNRAVGDRLNHNITPEAYRAASALLLLSPQTPLIFMGQEWAASTPFLFFTDHPPALGQLVTAGRRAEFAAFASFSGTTVPDPQDRATFLRSKLRWDERDQGLHEGVLQLYHDLLALRRQHPALRDHSRESFAVAPLGETALALRRMDAASGVALLLFVNLRGSLRLDIADQDIATPPANRSWHMFLSSEDERYGGYADTCRVEDGRTIAIDGPGALLLESYIPIQA